MFVSTTLSFYWFLKMIRKVARNLVHTFGARSNNPTGHNTKCSPIPLVFLSKTWSEGMWRFEAQNKPGPKLQNDHILIQIWIETSIEKLWLLKIQKLARATSTYEEVRAVCPLLGHSITKLHCASCGLVPQPITVCMWFVTDLDISWSDWCSKP